MTDAIGATTNGVDGGAAGSAVLRSTWLGLYSGNWYNGFNDQGSYGLFWSASQLNATNAYQFNLSSSGVNVLHNYVKGIGFAVRCVMIEPAKTGDKIQTVTTANCPATRIRVNDARDDATYWIQKMADGRCWMLTNLAYGGGGTNTYGDVKAITDGSSTSYTYTTPYYYVPTGSNRTTGTTDPSTSTTGVGQYGYLYNWCAAMGTQLATSACANATTPAPDASMSICPSGWRLPTSSTGGEFEALTTATGATNSAAGSTALRSTWLGVYSGFWGNGFLDQGSYGYFWSASQNNAALAYGLSFNSSNVYPSDNGVNKVNGFAVRCVAS